jgi:Ca-activated chloride channel family protein
MVRREFLGLLPGLALGQDPPTFSVDVQLVSMGFLVRDQAGKLVPALDKDAFEVFENKQKQEIRNFSREEKMPLTLGLIVDRSGSQDQFEQENVYAAVTFFRSILRAQDQAFVVSFGNRIRLTHDLSSELNSLERGLKYMKKEYDRAPRLGPAVNRNGGSAVLDAAYWSAREKLKGVSGRKALIMIGDGKENASETSLVDLIDLLQNEDILFYGLDNGGATTEENRRLRNRMPAIADESGGRVFDTNKVPMRKAFEEIEQELRTLYTLGYATTNPARDGRYRKVEIRAKEPGVTVRAKPGYYAR